LLKVEDIHVYYGNIYALKGVSIKVNEGEIVTIIGANGAGKSTTLNTIIGLQKAKQGTISFYGKNITNSPPYLAVEKGLCLVPEGRRIYPRFTVIENLFMGVFQRKDKNQVNKDIEAIFEKFPQLYERRNKLGSTLSGGEQQMLAIGRALVSKPKLLLMDEPSLGLAPILVEEVFGVINQIKNEGTTILLVEQNALKALKVADRGYVLQTGKIVIQGTSQELLKNEDIKKAYLGRRKNI